MTASTTGAGTPRGQLPAPFSSPLPAPSDVLNPAPASRSGLPCPRGQAPSPSVTSRRVQPGPEVAL
ncbi:MAG: hypothetical protein LBT40_18870 [Deltaproteobacteria bacterium]|nr:hypothetical protein [Deltaproteobacteria bacterium]